MLSKQCKKCKDKKFLEAFHPSGHLLKDGSIARRTWCKECTNADNREHWPFYYTDTKRDAIIMGVNLMRRNPRDYHWFRHADGNPFVGVKAELCHPMCTACNGTGIERTK